MAREAFGAQRGTKSQCSFFLDGSQTPIWPVWGGGRGPQGKKSLGRKRGSKEPSQEVKSSSRELQNDMCMLISSPSLNFHVFLSLLPWTLKRKRWKQCRKNNLKRVNACVCTEVPTCMMCRKIQCPSVFAWKQHNQNKSKNFSRGH